MTKLRSDPELLRESEELLKDCVKLEDALLAFPSLSEGAIRKAALYGSIRTPARGLYYMPDLKTLELRQWKVEK